DREIEVYIVNDDNQFREALEEVDSIGLPNCISNDNSKLQLLALQPAFSGSFITLTSRFNVFQE
ncbi:MAG: hypothetical protein KAR20_24090, partial [Candidatus Heimdallarchaeota archaeon]|nr:hypothetical protein [Candidatus Heimdallarchaeota archaeon]